MDAALLTGALSAAVSATPGAPADTVPPSVPAPLSATPDASQPTVHLAWAGNKPLDGGTAVEQSGGGYIVERQQSGSSTWQRLRTLYPGTTYDDTTAGWSTTSNYRVFAQDGAGNTSGYATAGPVTTVALVLRSVRVTNNSNVQTWVWMQNVATSRWYTTSGCASTTQPAGVWVKKTATTPPGTSSERPVQRLLHADVSLVSRMR